MNICKLLSIFVLLFCFSCDKPLPTLEGIDKERWENDKSACNNVRNTMREAIDHEKEKLLSLNQTQIVRLLGRPDQNELSTRNQKFFYYFIDPAPSCNARADSLAERLVIRFSAVGLATEVAIE